MLSLMDAVAAQEVTCKVPGCKNKWTLAPKEVVQNWKHNNYRPPKRMCPSCREKFAGLQPLEVNCSTKDCEHKVNVAPYHQLILLNKGRRLEQEHFTCEDCQKLIKDIGDQAVPCRIKGCGNTWVWYASSRLRAGGKELKAEPEARLCDSCFEQLQKLSPQKRTCRIPNCTHQWVLDRMTQLELQVNHKKEPKRMCQPCSTQLKELQAQQRPCRTEGCANTWEWSPYAQLEYARTKEQNPSLDEPHRYCDHCFYLSKKLQPLQIACHKPGCPFPVEYSVEWQIEDVAQKKKHAQRGLFCSNCQAAKQQLQDQQRPCQQESCSHTWIWSKEEQFLAGTYKDRHFVEAQPPVHSCQRCHDFLLTHSDTHVNCNQCQSPILWTARQQLMTELGVWVAPNLCPNCLKTTSP